MDKYVKFLMAFHFGFVCVSYVIASLMPDESDKEFMFNWFLFHIAVFAVWLPLYLHGLGVKI